MMNMDSITESTNPALLLDRYVQSIHFACANHHSLQLQLAWIHQYALPAYDGSMDCTACYS
jgi:hypothetical protein